MLSLQNAQKEILFVQLLLEHAVLPTGAEFAADRAAFYQVVAAVYKEAPRPEMFGPFLFCGAQRSNDG